LQQPDKSKPAIRKSGIFRILFLPLDLFEDRVMVIAQVRRLWSYNFTHRAPKPPAI
jgi:hypothetical protein